MCAEFPDLEIATGTPVRIGEADSPTTLNYGSVTFGADAELIVQGATTLRIARRLDAGPSGKLIADGAVAVTIHVETLAGFLRVNSLPGASGQIAIFYGSTEPGWGFEAADGALRVTLEPIR